MTDVAGFVDQTGREKTTLPPYCYSCYIITSSTNRIIARGRLVVNLWHDLCDWALQSCRCSQALNRRSVDHRVAFLFNIASMFQYRCAQPHPIMSVRPIICDSRLIRVLCPLKQSTRHFATAVNPPPPIFQASPSPGPSSIDNDQIARLASKPLHSLTLADLVR